MPESGRASPRDSSTRDFCQQAICIDLHPFSRLVKRVIKVALTALPRALLGNRGSFLLRSTRGSLENRVCVCVCVCACLCARQKGRDFSLPLSCARCTPFTIFLRHLTIMLETRALSAGPINLNNVAGSEYILRLCDSTSCKRIWEIYTNLCIKCRYPS